jgi:hypothetical protein
MKQNSLLFPTIYAVTMKTRAFVSFFIRPSLKRKQTFLGAKWKKFLWMEVSLGRAKGENYVNGARETAEHNKLHCVIRNSGEEQL